MGRRLTMRLLPEIEPAGEIYTDEEISIDPEIDALDKLCADHAADPPLMSDQPRREIRWCCEWWPPD
jgi:hypothetical protein